MVYLFESKIPENKSVLYALTSIYGIGKSQAFLICCKLGFSVNLKVKELTKEQISKLIKTVQTLNLELASDLKKIKILTAKRLISIKSYKGLRRNQGLPVRGQRTHTNARTARKRF
jgi:small subunit ribosomal protein S13